MPHELLPTALLRAAHGRCCRLRHGAPTRHRFSRELSGARCLVPHAMQELLDQIESEIRAARVATRVALDKAVVQSAAAARRRGASDGAPEAHGEALAELRAELRRCKGGRDVWRAVWLRPGGRRACAFTRRGTIARGCHRSLAHVFAAARRHSLAAAPRRRGEVPWGAMRQWRCDACDAALNRRGESLAFVVDAEVRCRARVQG